MIQEDYTEMCWLFINEFVCKRYTILAKNRQQIATQEIIKEYKKINHVLLNYERKSH